MTNAPDPKNNAEYIQKKSNVIAVTLNTLVILAVSCLGLFFPAYGASYSNIIFDVVLGIGYICYAVFAYQLWNMTFVEYDGNKITRVIFSSIGIILWICAWGSYVYGHIMNKI